MIKKILIGVSSSVFLSGCQTLLAPKIAPTSLNSQPATVSGAAISGGGLVGGAFGEDLNTKDRQLAVNAEYKALEYGKANEVSQWLSSVDTTSGKVTAAQPYRVGSQDCRQYTHEIVLSGATRLARGTACRNNNGSWSLLE